MDNIVVIKNAVLVAAAMAGSAIANWLGGWDAALQVLIALMAADYITGLMVAGIWRRSAKSETGALDSRAGFKGIAKKCSVLMLVWVAVLLDSAIGASYVRMAVVLFFVGNEGLSLLENLGLMGVPFPGFLQSALQALRDSGDKGGESQ